MKKTIYELELHEVLILDAQIEQRKGGVSIVTRVPGGWIYSFKMASSGSNGIGLSESSVFVPYNEEFKK